MNSKLVSRSVMMGSVLYSRAGSSCFPDNSCPASCPDSALTKLTPVFPR